MRNDELQAAVFRFEKRVKAGNQSLKKGKANGIPMGRAEIEFHKDMTLALTALRDVLQRQLDPDTGLMPCGGKMRIDIPPGNDSVRASPGFQRDGGDKTERRCNQCVVCGAEMAEGDHVCGLCRGDE